MFVAPQFLWATGAAVVPLLLHLLSKKKTVRIYFSTLRFLQLAQKQSSRRIRLENFLLWLLRTVLILLIACAFALPTIKSAVHGSLFSGSARDVAIVWDESFSMGYESSRANVWEESRQTILDLLVKKDEQDIGLKKGDRASLIIAGEEPFALIAKPSAELDKIATLVKNRKPGQGSSSLQPAILKALATLRDSGTREKELIIVTDGQAVPWSRMGVAAPAGGTTNRPGKTAMAQTNAPAAPQDWPPPELLDKSIPVYLTLVGVSAPENAAPIQVDVYPALLRSDIPGQVWVRVLASGAARDSSVVLYVDDKEVGRQNIKLGNNRIEETAIALPPQTVGTHFARVETPRDGLPIDDTFHFLLRVKEKFRVLSVGSSQDLFFLERALNPGGRAGGSLETRSVTTDGLLLEKLEDFSAVFLCNCVPLPGQALLQLERYVRDGGLLIVIPGDRGQPADYANLISLPAKPLKIQEFAIKDQRKTLRLVKPRDPIFSSLKLQSGAVPAIAIQRALLCEPVDKLTEVLVSADADLPFLYSRNFGRGRVLLMTVSADRAWSTLPLSSLFLPLMHQMVLAGAGQGEPPLSTWTSRDLELSPFLSEAPEGTSLIGPDRATLPLRRFINNGVTTLHAENILEPGIYRLAKPGAETRPLLAVNVPRNESDLTMLKPDEVRARLGVPDAFIVQGKDDLAHVVKEHRVGNPLAEHFLWLAFLIAVFEWGLSNRINRKTASLTSRMLVEASGRVHAHA
jgi:hypothetical protein